MPFNTPKMMPYGKENYDFRGGFPLPSSMSALVGFYETRAVFGWAILNPPNPKQIFAIIIDVDPGGDGGDRPPQ